MSTSDRFNVIRWLSDRRDGSGSADRVVDATLDVSVRVVLPPLVATLGRVDYACGPDPVFCMFASSDSPEMELELKLEFSEPLPDGFDPETLRLHGFEVVNTEVVEVSRVDGRSDLWLVTVAFMNADATVTLRSSGSCGTEHAVCSAVGVPLSNSPTLRVGYGGGPLTADFREVPSSHDGVFSFDVEVHFSKAMVMDPAVMRDEAIDISGGTVARAERSRQSNRRWTLTIYPEPEADVVIEIPVETDCSGGGAICSGLLTLDQTATVVVPSARPRAGPLLEDVSVSVQPKQELVAVKRYVAPPTRGRDTYFVRLEFTLEPDITIEELRQAFTVTGGTIKTSSRLGPPTRSAGDSTSHRPAPTTSCSNSMQASLVTHPARSAPPTASNSPRTCESRYQPRTHRHPRRRPVAPALTSDSCPR